MKYGYLGRTYNGRRDLVEGILLEDYLTRQGPIEQLEQQVKTLTSLVGLLLEHSDVPDRDLVANFGAVQEDEQ